jgi:BMFP domain-containing protein YqiC
MSVSMSRAKLEARVAELEDRLADVEADIQLLV